MALLHLIVVLLHAAEDGHVAPLVGERLLGPVLVVVILAHVQDAPQLECRTIENSLSSSLIF